MTLVERPANDASDARMSSNDSDVLRTLSEQCRHQLRLIRRWRGPWIPWLFVIGTGVSILGVVGSVEESRWEGSLTPGVFGFGLFTVLFGAIVVRSLIAPLLIRPRIVPYFARQLGEYRGPTMLAFARGQGLYREIVTLDWLARTLGVKPLSAFGFAYDHYEQEVRWHPASDGLRTVEALRHGVGASLLAAPDVAADLDALALAMRAAADQGVDFSLVLRLYTTDSLQACSREVRQGSFW
jgi:hypothetical protein